MILEGNSRGGAKNLADHLMSHENDHITVHELRGFASENLHGALNESYAISRGTQCRQFLYSLSLNPPPDLRVSTAEFEAAIDKAEERLGLTGHPRAIVFHEKEGPGGMRRHAHAVWNRINQETMTARNMSFDRDKLQDVSRELYREHGWRMPEGFADRSKRDPRNFTLAQWQEAKRQGKDPRETIDALQDSWAISDNRAAFDHALRERGFYLARGDRRGFVAIDTDGTIHSISKKAKIKPKELQGRLGDPNDLQSVEQVKDQMAQDMGHMLGRLYNEQACQAKANKERYEQQKRQMVEQQRQERQRLEQEQQQRLTVEQRQRQERFRRGVLGLWDRITGEHKRIAEQNRLETIASQQRDQCQRDAIIQEQLDQRRTLIRDAQSRQEQLKQAAQELQADKERYLAMRREEARRQEPERTQTVQQPQPPPPIKTQDQSQSDDREAARQRFIEQRRDEAEQERKRQRMRGPSHNGPSLER